MLGLKTNALLTSKTSAKSELANKMREKINLKNMLILAKLKEMILV